jgi:hypothetical protein
MKMRYLIPLTLALLGCSSTIPRTTTLTAEQAGTLARQLANAKAQALFNSQPFRGGPPAQLVRGHWIWHDLRGQGSGDIEASVEFAVDGTNPDVSVTRLDNHRILQ